MSEQNKTALARVEQAGAMALEPRSIQEGMQLAEVAAKTKLFGVTSKDDAFVRMATGMGLGLSAWQSLRGLFVISGKVGLSADLMLALCLSSPECDYFRCTETTAERATFKAKRRGDEETVLSFTMAEARTAGLTSNSMYAKYPANMLRARAIAFLARLLFPERMHGILTREEIDGIEAERQEGRRDAQALTVEPEGRSTILSPPPDALRSALASWERCQATDEEVATIAGSADPQHRRMVFGWRIDVAETLEELASVATDLGVEPHEAMRTEMLKMAEAARVKMAGVAA